MPEFSLDLNEDQLQLQKWIHEFAESVIRPVASEWDEREEFPWPVVEEAAQIELYGWEFMAEAMMNDPTGLTLVLAIAVFDEAFPEQASDSCWLTGRAPGVGAHG